MYLALSLIAVFFLIGFYWLVARPALERIFPAFYGRINTIEGGAWQRMSGVRTVLIARLHVLLGGLISALMTLYTFLQPILDQSGIDWKSFIPPDKAVWLIPVIMIASGLIFEAMRKQKDAA